MSSSLAQHQERELREAFDMFDRDKSGKISAKELKSVFKALGINASDQEVRTVLRQMDSDGDGEISFREFLRVMGNQYYRRYTNEEIQNAFNYFDRDHSGFITSEELADVLARIGRHYTEDEIRRMIRSVDRDGNGKISIQEFTQLLS